MIMVLHDEIFASWTAFEGVGFFSNIANSVRHIAILDDNQGPNFKKWHAELAEPLRSNVAQLLDFFSIELTQRAASTTIHVVQSVTQGVDRNEVDVVAVAKIILQPFRLYVENSRNDRRFLLACATASQAERIKKMETNGELTLCHAGGIEEMIEQLVQDVQQGRCLTFNSMALFDSDALRPNSPSSSSQRLSAACQRLGVPYKQLLRRAIENYITKNALRYLAYSLPAPSRQRRQELKNTFCAFVDLPHPLPHHYNMKSGIERDRRRSDYPADDEIYREAISIKSIAALEKGFGKDVSHLFDANIIVEADLRREGSWEEMNGIVQELESLL